MSEMGSQIILTAEDGEEICCYIIEETRIAGVDYLLVADSEEGDAECMILKDTSASGDAESAYEIVEDENEQQYLLRIFQELLDDCDLS